DVAAAVERELQILDQAFVHRMHETHGEQHQVGVDLELGAGHRLELVVDAGAVQLLDRAVVAGEPRRHHREFAVGAFLVARRGAQLERPIRPGQHLVFAQRRLRQDFEIEHRNGALAERGADAVGASIAAADDDDALAAGEDRLRAVGRFARHPPVLLRQIVHGEVDAVELAAGDRQVAALLGAAGQHHSVMPGDEFFRRDIDADVRAVMKDHALGLHLRDATVDVRFFHLEVGNAVAQEPAGLGEFLVDVDLVAGARQLLGAGQPGRPGAYDRHRLAGSGRRQLGLEPLGDGAVGDGAFDRFDGDRVLVDVERARGLARRRADPSGDLGKIVGRMQIARGLVPVAVVDEVVPVGDLIVDRAARRAGRQRAGAHAIRHAAIHAARRLRDGVLLGQRQHELAPMAQALRDRFVVAVLAFVFEKTGDLAHALLYSAAIAAAFISLRARRYSTGITLRNFGYHAPQSARILAATAEPVKRAWRAIKWRSRCASKVLRSAITSTRP